MTVLIVLTRGEDEELGVRVKDALRAGVLVYTGVEVEVDDGVGVEVELVGVYPDGTRVRVLVTAAAEAEVTASAASTTGARRRTKALLRCMLTSLYPSRDCLLRYSSKVRQLKY